MSEGPAVESLISAVRAAPNYRHIEAGLVARLAAAELAKGRDAKAAVKAVRGKLHQAAGAYRSDRLDLAGWTAELAQLPRDPSDPALRAWCREKMQQHASTRERLPFLDDFFTRSLAGVGAVQSLLDLGCGLNPLALPWLNLAPGATYYGCDLYSDLADFGDVFRRHLGLAGAVTSCDLTVSTPTQPVALALALKMIPCLEQLDKSVGSRLLAQVNAQHVLVSFPARSLGGRAKGMGRTYETRFLALISGMDWQARRFDFPNELAFMLSRSKSGSP